MNAKKAREIADLANSKRAVDHPVMQKITAAAQEGALEIRLIEGVDYALGKECVALSSMLQSLGYDVTFARVGADESMFVTWNK